MYRAIVVGTDGSDTAGEAVRQATELAHRLGGRLLIVSAYEPITDARVQKAAAGGARDPPGVINPRGDVDATLQSAREGAQERGVEVQTFARQGDPADAILDVAEEQNADLI